MSSTRAPFVVVIALAGCGAAVAKAPPVEKTAPAGSVASLPAASPATTGSASALPPKDSDGDGIPDESDKCPNEPETYNGRDDEDGCPDKTVAIISSNPPSVVQITFAKGAKTTAPSMDAIFDAVAQVMKEHPEVELVQIEAHAEKGEAGPLTLSRARAEAVRAAVVKRGIAAARLRAKGFAAHCGTASGGDADRRAEFKVVVKSGQPTGVALGCPAATAAGIAPD